VHARCLARGGELVTMHAGCIVTSPPPLC